MDWERNREMSPRNPGTSSHCGDLLFNVKSEITRSKRQALVTGPHSGFGKAAPGRWFNVPNRVSPLHRGAQSPPVCPPAHDPSGTSALLADLLLAAVTSSPSLLGPSPHSPSARLHFPRYKWVSIHFTQNTAIYKWRSFFQRSRPCW